MPTGASSLTALSSPGGFRAELAVLGTPVYQPHLPLGLLETDPAMLDDDEEGMEGVFTIATNQ